MSCPTCGMVYTKGQPEDNMEHIQFHKKFVSGISFPVSVLSYSLPVHV